jgi:signal transduction histidine kinase
MRTFSTLSLRAKLMVIVMITTCASLLLVAGALAVFDVVSHRRTLTEETATIAQILGDNSRAALLFDNAADATDVLGALASQPDVVSGCLYDGVGGLFASYVRRGQGLCPQRPAPEATGFLGESLILYHPVMKGGESVGILRLVASLARLRQRVQLSAVVLLLVLLAAVLAALLLSARLQGLVSRPILELAHTAKQISENRDYTLRAPQRTQDEIGVAVLAFNQMLDRIADADRALRALNTTLEERVAERTAAAEERADALRRSNEELEGFAYVASHDLQAPLRAVLSYAQLVQRQLAGKTNPELDLYLEHVIGGAARMRELVRDLLDYSHVGRQASKLDAVAVDGVLEAVLSDLSPIINEHKAQVIRGELPVVMADRGQLAQLLSNLISNAIRFQGETPPVIQVGAERAGDQWRFAVRDNGIGIEPRHFERIFVMFQRLHGHERPGTGIGLAICKKIVAGHRGQIWVESEVGRGSTFYFTLPAVAAAAPPS